MCVWVTGLQGLQEVTGVAFIKNMTLNTICCKMDFLGVCVWVAGLQGLQKVTWVAFFFKSESIYYMQWSDEF